MAEAQLAAFLKDYPNVKFISPSSPDYPSAREVWNHGRQDKPLAIVQPQSAAEISALVKYARSQDIKFTVRGGGHNLEGRAIVEGALTIDLRALTSVAVAADRQSATVGGGILFQDLATKLWHEGLATPVGTIPSVGYVGWAIYGGYGPLSGHWGLGVDQIIDATVVNADGDIVKADETLLKGIRGAGGVFGVIVDLTIKVYPLGSLLAGVILYDARDITKTITEFNAAYQKVLDEGLPLELTLQQMAVNSPSGRLFGVSFVWSSDDTEEGQQWSKRIASLGTVLMNTVAATTLPDWLASNGALVPSRVYGSSRTHNLYHVTPQVTEVLGRNLAKMPSDLATMFSIHQLRGPGATPHDDSIFASREPHFMLEVLGFSTKEETKAESEQWASDLADDVQKNTDAGNILPQAYISLALLDQASLSKFYGPYAQEVLALKKRYDPDGVFSLTVPKLN